MSTTIGRALSGSTPVPTQEQLLAQLNVTTEEKELQRIRALFTSAGKCIVDAKSELYEFNPLPQTRFLIASTMLPLTLENDPVIDGHRIRFWNSESIEPYGTNARSQLLQLESNVKDDKSVVLLFTRISKASKQTNGDAKPSVGAFFEHKGESYTFTSSKDTNVKATVTLLDTSAWLETSDTNAVRSTGYVILKLR